LWKKPLSSDQLGALKNNVKESSICALEIGKDHFQELGSGDLAFGNFILDNDYILFHGREEWCLYSLNDKKIADTTYQLSENDFKEGYAILKKGKKVFHKLEK